MRIRFTAITVLLLVICHLTGCVQNETGETVKNKQMQNINDEIGYIYSNVELADIYSFKGTLSELNQKYPVECMRETERMKTAVYLSDNSIVFVYFDLNGNQSAISNKYGLQHTSAEFRAIPIGKKLADVMEFDPDGSYLFLYTGMNLSPHSTHCTKDGYLVTITYDEQNTVTGIYIQMI